MNRKNALAEDSEAMSKPKKLILYVDNEWAVIEPVNQILNRLGYETVVTTWCSEAVNLMRSQPERFDLVITDMNMPDMDGFELSRALKEIRPDIPILLCTGFGALVNRQDMAAAGISEVIPKPFSIKDISMFIENALERS
jgi:CheY-like chemotaxis protein